MKKILFTCFCIVFVAFSSCVKPGKGGKAILSIHVFEGVSPCNDQDKTVVPNAIVYIKYGGTSPDSDVLNYDASQLTDFGGKTVFTNLKRGEYYLYAVKDTIVLVNSVLVNKTFTGGEKFDIRNRIGEREIVICAN